MPKLYNKHGAKRRLSNTVAVGHNRFFRERSELYKEGSDYTQEALSEIRHKLGAKAPLICFSFQQQASGEHWISITSPELTAICPFSDYPDFGSVTIHYVPQKRCLELKSFKLYINAFRDVKIFHEALTEVIFADFLKTVAPKKAWIEIDMNVRGNVKTVCRKYYKTSPVCHCGESRNSVGRLIADGIPAFAGMTTHP